MEQVYSRALKASGDHKEHPAQLLHTRHCRDLSLAQTCCMGTDLSPWLSPKPVPALPSSELGLLAFCCRWE